MKYLILDLILAFFILMYACLAVSSMAAAQPISPAQAAEGFTASYNCTGAWARRCQKTPHVITRMYCRKSSVGPGAFACEVRLARRDGSRKPICGAIVIDSGFDVLENDHLFPCADWPKTTVPA